VRPERRLPVSKFAVALEAHTVERWEIPARRVTIPAASAEQARRIVVGEAHGRAGVPPMKALVRTSLTFATAKATIA